MTIYLDLDGVFFDFNGRIAALGIPHNNQWFEPRETWTEETLRGEEIKKEAMHTAGFWKSLPVLPGSRFLWQECSRFNPYVLTAKPHFGSPELVATEKLEAINEYLGPFPAERFICCERHEKKDYARSAVNDSFNDNILIDDDPRNCEAWINNGGAAILHTDPMDSLKKLGAILYG